jgi:hypothetical protein
MGSLEPNYVHGWLWNAFLAFALRHHRALISDQRPKTGTTVPKMGLNRKLVVRRVRLPQSLAEWATVAGGKVVGTGKRTESK